MRWTIDLPNLAATERLAAAVAGLVQSGDVIALEGDLGAGKTAFARALINARIGPVEVPSPTFNLVLTYDGADGLSFWHFDLYRLERPEDALELGLDEALDTAVSLIEWPDRAGSLLPADRLAVRLTITGDALRHALIDAPPDWAARLGDVARRHHWTEVDPT